MFRAGVEAGDPCEQVAPVLESTTLVVTAFAPCGAARGYASTVVGMNELDDFARLASGYNGKEILAATPAALEQFQALNAETRRMVLQLLDNTDDPARWQQLDNHPDSKELWKWMVTLPRLNLPPRGDKDDV